MKLDASLHLSEPVSLTIKWGDNPCHVFQRCCESQMKSCLRPFLKTCTTSQMLMVKQFLMSLPYHTECWGPREDVRSCPCPWGAPIWWEKPSHFRQKLMRWDEDCVYLEESRKGLLVCQPVSRTQLFSLERSKAKTKSRMNCRPLIIASFGTIFLPAPQAHLP